MITQWEFAVASSGEKYCPLSLCDTESINESIRQINFKPNKTKQLY